MQDDEATSDTRVLLGYRAVKRDYEVGRTKFFDLIKSGEIESVLDGGKRLAVKESLDARVKRLRQQESAGGTQ